jgi:hypothetical protein
VAGGRRRARAWVFPSPGVVRVRTGRSAFLFGPSSGLTAHKTVVATYGVGRAVALILPLGAAGRPPSGYTRIPGRQPSLAVCPVRGCGTSLFERTPERSANHADRDG